MGVFLVKTTNAPASVIIFDLYGTLIRMKASEQKNSLRFTLDLLKGRRKDLGSDVASFIRAKLLTRDIQSYADFVREYDTVLPSGKSETGTYVRQIFELLVHEFESAYFTESSEQIMAYCRALYSGMFLFSNASSYHKKAVEKLHISRFFDQCIFSCDVGFAKPAPQVYELITRRAAVSAEALIFIGDSYRVDYLAPLEHGSASIHVSHSRRAAYRVSDLKFLPIQLFDSGRLSLSSIVQRIFGAQTLGISVLYSESMKFNKQNMMYLVLTDRNRLVAKFHGNRNAAYIEYVGYQLLTFLGLFDSECWYVSDGQVACILLPHIESVKPYSMELDLAEIETMGKFAAFSYIFGNIDFRLRNVIRSSNGLHLIDLEHIFFIESNIYTPDNQTRSPFRPEMISRVMRTFLTGWALTEDAVEAFGRGFRELTRIARHRPAALQVLLTSLIDEKSVITGGLSRHKVVVNRQLVTNILRRMAQMNVEETLSTILQVPKK